MQVQYPRCCGLDVHKASVVAWLLQLDAEGQRSTEIRTFGTTTDDLLSLGDWLRTSGATHVAMEATGSYWKPVFNLLEGQFTVWVVNAAHIKAVPGHKTDSTVLWLCAWTRQGGRRGWPHPSRHGVLPATAPRHLSRSRSVPTGRTPEQADPAARPGSTSGTRIRRDAHPHDAAA